MLCGATKPRRVKLVEILKPVPWHQRLVSSITRPERRPGLEHPTGGQPQWSLASIARGDCPTLSGTVKLTEPAEEKERAGLKSLS